MHRSLRITVGVVLGGVLLASLARALNVPVVMRGYDLTRSGQTPNEEQLTTGNVNDGGFGNLFDYPVNGQVYAQPLYVPDLPFPNGSHHNTLFVATMGDEISALDADAPLVPALWTKSLGTPVSLTANPALGSACGIGTYKDFIGTLGVTSTPTIDLATQTLYVVAMTEETPQNVIHRLHALDLATGAEKFNGPVQIAGFYPGTGHGAVNGGFTFNSAFQNQRPSLVEANGRIYVAFAGFCDTRPFQGWVFGYQANDLSAAPDLFNDEPTGPGFGGAGIWMSGAPPAVDDAGFVYLTTGNGDTSTPGGGQDFGEAVLKLTPDLKVSDSFTPFDFAALNASDQDLGITTFIFIPGTHLGLIGCKTGKVYLLDRENLGGYHAGADTQIPQWFQAATPGHHIHGSPVLWSYPGGNRVFVWAENDPLRAYDFIADGAGGGLFDAGTAATSNLLLNLGMPGGMLSVSQNGPAADTAILWAATPIAGDANHATVSGRLLAFDAKTLGEPLWNSDWNARDNVGSFAKFVPPMVVNGKVFLATFSNAVRVYGLLGSTYTSVDGPAVTMARVPAGIEAQVGGYRLAGVAAGSVVFIDSTGAARAAALDDAGTGRYDGTGLHPGSYTLTAEYGGLAPALKSKSPTFAFSIIPQPTGTALEPMPADARFGSAVVLTAHVLGAATRPEGSVLLTEDDAGVGTLALDDAGMARFSVVALSVGAHRVRARFEGSTDFAASQSPESTLLVGKALSTLTLSAAPGAPEAGATVTLRAQLTAGAAGTVTFSSAGQELGSGTTNVGSEVTVTTAFDAGTYGLTASYAGDSSFEASEGTLSLTVYPAGAAPDAGTHLADAGPGTPDPPKPPPPRCGCSADAAAPDALALLGLVLGWLRRRGRAVS